MKTKFKRIGRQSVSVILAVMMMLSTMLVGMVTSNAAYSAHFYVVGAPVNDSDWSQKSALIDNSYGKDSVYYIDIDLTQNTYFALHNGSHQYGPVNGGEEIGLNSTKSNNTYAANQWKYTGETGKKRIVVDQSSSEWYPSIKIEEIPDTTKLNVKVNYDPAHVSSITLDGKPVASSGDTVPVDNGATPTLKVALNQNCSITSVTQDGNPLTAESNGTYKLSSVIAETTITVTTTSSSSGGEGTLTDYKLLVGQQDSDVGNYNESSTSTSTKKFPVYQLSNDTYYAIVPANTFVKDNNFFALSSNGYSSGIQAYSSSSDDSTLSSDVNWIKKQSFTPKEFVIVNFNKDIDYDVKITYKAGVYTISRAAAPVTTHEVKLTQESSLNATVKVTSGTTTTTLNSTTVANVAENSTYTLSVKPASGYRITGIYVGGSLISEPINNPYIENSFTKEMGTADVDVEVTTEVAPSYDITTTDYDKTQGTVLVSPTSCKVGETFTVTATPEPGYDVKSVTVTDSLNNPVSPESGSGYTYKMPASNVTVTVTFKESQGTADSKYKLMHSNNKETLVRDVTGNTVKDDLTFYLSDTYKYSVTVPIGELNKSSNNFLAFSTKGKNEDARLGMVARGSTEPTWYADDETNSYFQNLKIEDLYGKLENDTNTRYFFVFFTFKSDVEVTSVTITYDESKNKYYISADVAPQLKDAFDVYVTDGNLTNIPGENKYGLRYGKTEITSGITPTPGYDNNPPTSGSYIKYIAKKDDKVTVQCTMVEEKAKLGYYVEAFVVNGERVEVIQDAENPLIYQTAAPITITENTEITPVYYNSKIKENGDYITLYVNAPDNLISSWGNSISIYSWYNNGGSEMDGAYPGQLMMRNTEHKYVAKVSKYAYSVDEKGNFVKDENKSISGITINNYHENQGEVHDKFLTNDQKVNRQSYDYDDFVKISEMGYDIIEFDAKYFTGSNRDDTNQKKLIGNRNTLNTEPNIKKLEKDDTYHVAGYQELKNIDKQPVSILGYDSETITLKQQGKGDVTGLKKDAIKIISVGNQTYTENNTTTKYATCWYVYDTKGEYVTCGKPSDFIPKGHFENDGNFVEDNNQSDAYKAIVQKGLQYNSALISYEVEQDAKTSSDTGNNTGIRSDGRWYYDRSVTTVPVNLGIIYKQSDSAPWIVDTPTAESSITGSVTGGTASFSYTDESDGKTYNNLAYAEVRRSTKLTINATNGTKYKFTGWAVLKKDADGNETYSPLSTTDFTATYDVQTATKLYAMYEPYPSGKLTLTHSKYVGEDHHNGLGVFTIEAYVGDINGKHDSSAVSPASVSDSVTLDITDKEDAYVWVTLKTESYAKSHFLNFYYPEVSKGTTTLTKDTNTTYYDRVCTAEDPATKRFSVKVSNLFVDGKQAIMALDYYSDLKLPEVASDITFKYNPYKEAPNPSPAPDMNGSGTTKFALTITEVGQTTPAYCTDADVASLTLKGNTDLKDILANLTRGTDYTVKITLNPKAGLHCDPGQTYRQKVNSEGNYTYIDATSDTGSDIWTYDSTEKTYSANLRDLFNTGTQEFKSNTINFYTNFTAQSFSYDVTFKYLGYESRAYYDKHGYTQTPIPSPEETLWRYYTVSGKFYGAEIDTYVNTETKTFKDAFLLKVAPYEDNFVQTILWNLDAVKYTYPNNNSIEATVDAEYDNGKVTVKAELPNAPSESYTVNYGSLVKSENYVGTTSLPEGKEGYLIVAPEKNGDKTFSYWTIEKELANGDKIDKIEVAKCYNREFNYIAYDNYTVTACYGEDVATAKDKVSATMTFLEYSRNQTASSDGKIDKVYADFAVSFDYYGKMLNSQKDAQNPNVICGVAFVVNSNYSSKSDAVQSFTVDDTVLLNKIKALNNGNTDKTLTDGSKVFNYKINKDKLDNKNRIEYSWKVSNNENNNNLTILAYSYIYNTETGVSSISAPQSFKFYNVGHKTYEN